MMQSRIANCESTIREYTEEIREGAVFPPGQAIFDKDTGRLYLVDGIHRAEAHAAAGRDGFPVFIQPGNEVKALLAASGSNADHGKKRNNKDKEHTVIKLLLNDELCRYNRLAKEARVSPQLIEKVRQKLEKQPGNSSVNPTHRIVERGGTKYTVPATATSGSKKDKSQVQTPEQVVAAAVKFVSKCIDKKSNDLPAELRDDFWRELQNQVDCRFSNTAKS